MKTKSLVVSILGLLGLLGLLGIGFVYRNSMLARGSDLVTDVGFALKKAKATEDAQLLAKQKAIIDAGLEAESGKPTGMLALAKDLLSKEQHKLMAEIEGLIAKKAQSVDRTVLASLITGQDEINKLLAFRREAIQSAAGVAAKPPVPTKKIRIEVPVTTKDNVALDLFLNEQGQFVIKNARDD
jgi:hypothetical protein